MARGARVVRWVGVLAAATASVACSDADELGGKPPSARGRPAMIGAGSPASTTAETTTDGATDTSTSSFDLVVTEAELAGLVGGIEFSGPASGQASLRSDGAWVQVYFDDGNRVAMTGVHVRDLAELEPGHTYSATSAIDLWAWACSGFTSLDYEARAVGATVEVSETDEPNVLRYDVATELPSGNANESTVGWFAVHW